MVYNQQAAASAPRGCSASSQSRGRNHHGPALQMEGSARPEEAVSRPATQTGATAPGAPPLASSGWCRMSYAAAPTGRPLAAGELFHPCAWAWIEKEPLFFGRTGGLPIPRLLSNGDSRWHGPVSVRGKCRDPDLKQGLEDENVLFWKTHHFGLLGQNATRIKNV